MSALAATLLQATKSILQGFNSYNEAKTDYKASLIRAEAENNIRKYNNEAKREHGIYRRFMKIVENENRNKNYERTLSALTRNWQNQQATLQSKADSLGLVQARRQGEIAAVQALSGLRGSVFDRINSAVSMNVANEMSALERASYTGQTQFAMDLTLLNTDYVQSNALDYEADNLDFNRSFASVAPSATQYLLNTAIDVADDVASNADLL